MSRRYDDVCFLFSLRTLLRIGISHRSSPIAHVSGSESDTDGTLFEEFLINRKNFPPEKTASSRLLRHQKCRLPLKYFVCKIKTRL